MNNGVKVILYVILVIATAVTGYFFFQNFGKLFEDPKPVAEAVAAAAPEPAAPAVAETNAPPSDTNVSAATNVTAEASAATNAVPGTNVVAEAAASTPPPSAPPASPAPAKKSRIGFWTGSFILCILALGGLVAWDVSNYMGSKSLKVLYNDDGEGQKDPEYDQAEQVWANGQPLEAVRLMREYYNKNPREVHVALRIAEIYEKDLNNFLAAALEYEEVLKKKLPDERWGWFAVRLCNLYFKLGQEVKAYALLQRIVKEYPETQAAGKARKRLSEVDPGLLAEAEPQAPSGKTAPPAAEEPKSNLPPGFRPKK